MSDRPPAPPSPSDPAPRRPPPAAALDKARRGERPCLKRWAAGQPRPHGTTAPSGPAGGRAEATAQGHASTPARPGVPVDRAETITMTATDYGNAVEAIAALIARTWDDSSDAEAA